MDWLEMISSPALERWALAVTQVTKEGDNHKGYHTDEIDDAVSIARYYRC